MDYQIYHRIESIRGLGLSVAAVMESTEFTIFYLYFTLDPSRWKFLNILFKSTIFRIKHQMLLVVIVGHSSARINNDG